MKSKRTSFALLLSTFGAVVLMANCTVKEAKDDGTCDKNDKRSGCECPGNKVGSQTCGSDGVFGECICPGTSTGGSSGNMGGETSTPTAGKNSSGGNATAGTSNGGAYANGGAGGEDVSPAEAGAGGAGGAGPDLTDCEVCLENLCPTQWAACNADPNCLSENGDGSGQYEKIMIDCVGMERVNGVVTRDEVRGCGFTMGVSSDPNDPTAPANALDVWAPEQMAQSTADIMNCMAMGASPAPDASWANDPTNFPNGQAPKPWPAGSCAKLGCTSQVQ